MHRVLGRLALATMFLTVAGAFVTAHATEDDLSGGVFVVHHPADVGFTEPPEGWCPFYNENLSIDCCAHQNPRIDVDSGQGAVWFVLSAWEEEKRFCGFAFGLANHPAWIFGFSTWGYCCPAAECLEIPIASWPNPLEGTAVVRGGMEDAWYGNFVPVY
ncbi:MAG: hypothetical protein GF330_02230 [Candidatus Eisenbacteria bacterium]|nr:hypothetical protein [Candidatus Eisenbacteria bacterium]